MLNFPPKYRLGIIMKTFGKDRQGFWMRQTGAGDHLPARSLLI